MKLNELADNPGDGGEDDEWYAERKEFEAKVLRYLQMLLQKNQPLQMYDGAGNPDKLTYDQETQQWMNHSGDTFSTEELPELIVKAETGGLQYNY